MAKLSELKELIFQSDNKACFIERERILSRLESEMSDYKYDDKYAIVLSKLLSEVSAPILDCDYFAGRVVEALPEENMKAPNGLLCSVGHMSFDYEKLLRMGLKGILRLYGFSEYFVSLPKWQQLAILNRTEYSA